MKFTFLKCLRVVLFGIRHEVYLPLVLKAKGHQPEARYVFFIDKGHSRGGPANLRSVIDVCVTKILIIFQEEICS